MKLISFDDLKTGCLNILPYGEPGCGKTHFGLSVGEVLHTLFVDVDRGIATALTVPPKWLDKIVPITFDDFGDLNTIYQMLYKNDPVQLSRWLGKDIKQPFEAVVFDTWTEVNWNIKEGMREDLSKSKAAFKTQNRLDFRPQFEFQDWGKVMDLNQVAIEAFRDLPITFVCCMHEIFVEDDKSGRIKGVPSINGKFAAEIGKHFDIVGHMSVNLAGEYVMDTVMKSRYQAKTRIPLDKQLKSITYKGILDAMK